MNKKYRVTFNSGNENGFRVYIGDSIINLQLMMTGFISVKRIICFGESG